MKLQLKKKNMKSLISSSKTINDLTPQVAGGYIFKPSDPKGCAYPPERPK